MDILVKAQCYDEQNNRYVDGIINLKHMTNCQTANCPIDPDNKTTLVYFTNGEHKRIAGGSEEFARSLNNLCMRDEKVDMKILPFCTTM